MDDKMNLKTENNLVSLTDIWIHSGKDRKINPANWKASIKKGYVENIAARTSEQVWKSKKGTNGYTLATWEIAFAYARWISVDLYREVVMEWCGGQAEVMAKFKELEGLTECGKDLLILTQMKGE